MEQSALNPPLYSGYKTIYFMKCGMEIQEWSG